MPSPLRFDIAAADAGYLPPQKGQSRLVNGA